jgi:hypothetical protein
MSCCSTPVRRARVSAASWASCWFSFTGAA